MKFLKCFIALVVISTSLGAVPVDKAAHMGAGFAGQVFCEAIVNRTTDMNEWVRSGACFGIIQGLGVVKEVTDPSRGGHNQKGDILANAIGGALAITFIKIGF